MRLKDWASCEISSEPEAVSSGTCKLPLLISSAAAESLDHRPDDDEDQRQVEKHKSGQENRSQRNHQSLELASGNRHGQRHRHGHDLRTDHVAFFPVEAVIPPVFCQQGSRRRGGLAVAVQATRVNLDRMSEEQ